MCDIFNVSQLIAKNANSAFFGNTFLCYPYLAINSSI